MAVNLNANPGVAANPGTLAFYNEYRDWDIYNDPPQSLTPLSVAQINAAYLATPFVPPPPVAPPVPLPLSVGLTPARKSSRRIQQVEVIPLGDVAAVAALLAPVPTLTGMGGANWTGVKHLGTGGGGAVALWEYTGPAPAPPIHSKIVVKEQALPSANLLNEGARMSDHAPALSEHIVALLVNPATVMTAATAAAQMLPGPAATWAGSVRRLIMEYCPSGSLEDLGSIRHERQIRLEELTMWKIFECLVDSCTVLEHRAEFVLDAAGNAQIPPNSIANTLQDPGVLIHFDIKTPNVLCVRDTRGGAHPDTPLCKLGDFGSALYYPRNGSGVAANGFFPMNWARNEVIRSRGTPGSYAPEQFSTRWTHSGFDTDPVCGKYSSATNVWGIGQVMYESHIPFNPGPLNAAPALGRAFGTEIQAVPHISALLKDTIQECLYEEPGDRPDLQDLKDRCRTSILALQASGVLPEGWQDLERLEPLTATQDVAPAFAARTRVPCNALKGRVLGTAQCGNSLTARANNPRPRCWRHWDLRRYPVN